MKRILCLALSLLLLCGCSAAPSAYVPTGDGLAYEEDYTGPTVQPPREETTQELTLTFYPAQTLNPYTCTDFTNRALFPLLYQSLFTIDRNYRVEPQLCKTYSVSADMYTYTFRLEDATFADGSALTAMDVAASLQAAKDSKVYSGRLLHVTHISSTGNTVTVELDTPCENLPLLLDIPIVKSIHITEKFPMGTGPYTLEGSTLRRRTNWWCDPEMQITAESIPLIRAESATQIRDNFEFHGLSLVCADPGSDRYADYRCDRELWDSENGIFLYLSFCKESKLFSDPKVRAAVTYAIDRDLLVSDFYRDFARSATLPASPLSPYYSTTLAAKYAFAPEKFSAVMQNQALPEEPIILLVNKDDSLRVRVAQAIANMLIDGGLPTQVMALSADECLDHLRYRTFDLYLGQTKLSPNMDLSAFFYGNGALSYGGVNDVAAYALCLQALENHGNYYSLHQNIMENGLLCPILVRSYAVYATRGLVTDLTPARDNIFYYSLGKTMEGAKRLS